jgi:hypothetical protein
LELIGAPAEGQINDKCQNPNTKSIPNGEMTINVAICSMDFSSSRPHLYIKQIPLLAGAPVSVELQCPTNILLQAFSAFSTWAPVVPGKVEYLAAFPSTDTSCFQLEGVWRY